MYDLVVAIVVSYFRCLFKYFLLKVSFLFSYTTCNSLLSNEISYMLSYYLDTSHLVILLNDQIHFISKIRYFNLSSINMTYRLALLVLSFNIKLPLVIPFRSYNFLFGLTLDKDHPYTGGHV